MPLALLLIASLAQVPAPLTGFQGTWELDPAASDDLAPLAKALGFSSWMLALAPKRPVQELAVEAQTLSVTGTGVRGRRTERFTVDGPATKSELLGRPFEVSTSVQHGVLESRGTIELDGKRTAFCLKRSVLASVMRLEIEVGELKALRVFNRLTSAH